jgi:capsular exopolysaccharide synthesis family protein
MRPSEKGLAAGRNPAAILTFWNKMHRYRCLVLKYWWVLGLTLSVAVCLAILYQMTLPISYLSSAIITVQVENYAPTMGAGEGGGTGLNQSLDEVVAVQVDILKSPQLVQLAADQLQAKHPGERGPAVSLEYLARSNRLTINATGTDAAYTQHYLQSRLDAYRIMRAKDRTDINQESSGRITEQLRHTEDQLKADDDSIIEFQRQNGVFFGKGDGAASTAAQMAQLRQKLNDLRQERDQKRLMSPEESLERGDVMRSSSGSGSDSAGNAQSRSDLEYSAAEADYRQAQADLVKIKAQIDDFSRDLRPKHPKMVDLNRQLDQANKVIANLLDQNKTRIANRLQLLDSLIKSTEDEITQAQPKVLQMDLLQAKFDSLQEQKQRDLKTYDELKSALEKASLGQNVDLDRIRVPDHPSLSEPVPSSWVKALAIAVVAGLATGIGILFCIDRMDDRMGSIADFQQNFVENIIGQIPRDITSSADENTELLRPDDERHMLVESFRNLRSTLLYMPLDGQRPKTLLVTSAVPNEGKSTVSSNLALVLAFAGMKTLLIDADLRRGAIHEAFGVTRDPGLTDVLRHNVKWDDAVRTTAYENLHVLPRGRNVPQPSEYLLSRSTDALIRELYSRYDYIIIDSSPILAADDTASLAPKIDATLFVVRLSFTSAKMTRKSLEILYNRQANIPGLILNQVDTSSPEFVYYQYSEYYHTATDESPGDSVNKSELAVKV